MKKLIDGVLIKKDHAVCDFCGEKKECFCIDKTLNTYGLKNNLELSWAKKATNEKDVEWFSFDYKVGPQKLYWMTDNPEFETKEIKFLVSVCSDCSKQLSKM